jgi:hypothetical protein
MRDTRGNASLTTRTSARNDGGGSRPGRRAPLPWVCVCSPLRGLRPAPSRSVRVTRPTVPTIVFPFKDHSQGRAYGASVLRTADPLSSDCLAKALAPVRLDGADCRPNGSLVVVQMPPSRIMFLSGHAVRLMGTYDDNVADLPSSPSMAHTQLAAHIYRRSNCNQQSLSVFGFLGGGFAYFRWATCCTDLRSRI